MTHVTNRGSVPEPENDEEAEALRKRQDALLDEALMETFPASDLVSVAQVSEL